MTKSKEPTIKLSELKEVYKSLCEAQKPLVRYELDDNLGMMGQAIFIKDRAITQALNFLYNKGIQQV